MEMDEEAKLPMRRELDAFESSHIVVAYPGKSSLNEYSPGMIGRIERDLGIYVHIPYCLRKCGYCHYVSEKPEKKEHMRDYVRLLKMELEIIAQQVDCEKRHVESISLGGGTPTMLEVEHLSGIMESIKESFNVKSNAEISIESCPATLLGKKDPGTLVDAGFNRLSIGIQSFDDGVLKVSNRSHNGHDAVMAYMKCVDAGFENINIDMMVGIPQQDVGILDSDIRMLKS